MATYFQVLSQGSFSGSDRSLFITLKEGALHCTSFYEVHFAHTSTDGKGFKTTFDRAVGLPEIENPPESWCYEPQLKHVEDLFPFGMIKLTEENVGEFTMRRSKASGADKIGDAVTFKLNVVENFKPFPISAPNLVIAVRILHGKKF